MFFVYVLKSLKDEKYYYGSTSDLEKRLTRHNQGRVKSTRPRIPFLLVYSEKFETKSEALKREMFFKTIDG